MNHERLLRPTPRRHARPRGGVPLLPHVHVLRHRFRELRRDVIHRRRRRRRRRRRLTEHPTAERPQRGGRGVLGLHRLALDRGV
eukprot:30362-Pelagococcus_subviridis.AAC.1